MKNSRAGSVIGAVLIIAVSLSLVLAGLLQWLNTESRLSRSSLLHTKARYAAESSAEFALAQMRATLERQPIITTNLFTVGGTPPVKPDRAMLGTTASTVLRDLGAGVGGAPYGRLDNVIAAVTRALDHGAGERGGGTGRYGIEAVTLAVSPISAEHPITMDRSNPLYANDPLRGLKIPVREVSIYSSARATDPGLGEQAMGYCVTTLQIRNVSLFDYISYYNLDLELSPAAGMDVYGPIHTNRNLYVQGGGKDTQTNFHQVVTAAGGIFHGRAPGVNLSANPGDVAFAGPGGALVSMKEGSEWLDSESTNWTGDAFNRWGSNVETSAHGVLPSLPVPIPVDDPETAVEDLNNAARVLIERATPNPTSPELELLKYSANACLVFKVGIETITRMEGSGESAHEVTTTKAVPKAFRYVRDDANGVYLRREGDHVRKCRLEELNVPDKDELWISREFYDRRWDRMVKSVDLNVGLLKTLIEDSSRASEWTFGSTEFNPSTDWNGVIYVEKTNTMDAVRLTEGRHVPNRPTESNDQAKGFTLATDAPLYIWGNYNADGNLPSDPKDIQEPDDSSEPPAAVVADAVTVLSTDWLDENSTAAISSRKAGQTEIAAAVIGGIVPSTNGEYSGGWHNMVRMLEDWSNVKLAFRSSMIVLYTSQVADTPWAGQSPVYEPPNRLFGLNALFQRGEKPPFPMTSPKLRRLRSRVLSEDEFNTAVAGFSGTP